MTDIIAVAAIVVVVGLALAYIIRAKKRGVKCVGCPSGGNCCASKKDGSECNCNCK
ncbi:MAG: FeoB-associated Cys-rich membrane protein [Clostridia bacterium]|nr:FeoB-associated Cys-rich membrane protein [Clostridia bacterium]MBQ4630744.1 FeoB-associated Cys-rich membrane protein [Clostridia bacterium]